MENLKEILELHEKWLNNEEGGIRADLSYADLSFADLSYADLKEANLSYANLNNTDLSNSNLSNAYLICSNLSKSNLRNANLGYTNLRYANLKNVDLEGTNLKGTDLGYTNLRYVNLKNVDLHIPRNTLTVFTGLSGSGKSTFLKTINRMNDLVPGVRITGEVKYRGRDIFSKSVDVNMLRKEVGMVFQKPNPFPMSIYDNIAYGPRTHGIKNKVQLDEIVENVLKNLILNSLFLLFLNI